MKTIVDQKGRPSDISKSGGNKRFVIVTILFLSVAAMTQVLFAQQQRMLHGTVHDPLGALVVGASVDLMQGEHVVASSKTDSAGTFHFAIPADGRYSVFVRAVSF